jgi:hypothetical protein
MIPKDYFTNDNWLDEVLNIAICYARPEFKHKYKDGIIYKLSERVVDSTKSIGFIQKSDGDVIHIWRFDHFVGVLPAQDFLRTVKTITFYEGSEIEYVNKEE